MRRAALNLRLRLAFVATAGLVTLVSACGSSKSNANNPTKALAHSAYKAEAVLKPPALAPPLALRNYLGKSVNLDSYRGKAALVTFIYTHCPDVCPLITSNLRVAQNLMGKAAASKVQIIAVSVDPRGDTRKTVTAFLARHEMTGRMQYLIGSAHELATAWKAWGVGSERDAQHPEFVEHSGLIYGITGSGERLTIYASNFQPGDIAHDVPLLAAR